MLYSIFGTGKAKVTWAVLPIRGTSIPKAPEYNIYVGELDSTVTDNMLLDFFRDKFSKAVAGMVVVDPETHLSKGYGFVKFTSEEESERAVQMMNGEKLLGRHIKTSQAHLKKAEL